MHPQQTFHALRKSTTIKHLWLFLLHISTLSIALALPLTYTSTRTTCADLTTSVKDNPIMPAWISRGAKSAARSAASRFPSACGVAGSWASVSEHSLQARESGPPRDVDTGARKRPSDVHADMTEVLREGRRSRLTAKRYGGRDLRIANSSEGERSHALGLVVEKLPKTKAVTAKLMGMLRSRRALRSLSTLSAAEIPSASQHWRRRRGEDEETSGVFPAPTSSDCLPTSTSSVTSPPATTVLSLASTPASITPSPCSSALPATLETTTKPPPYPSSSSQPQAGEADFPQSPKVSRDPKHAVALNDEEIHKICPDCEKGPGGFMGGLDPGMELPIP